MAWLAFDAGGLHWKFSPDMDRLCPVLGGKALGVEFVIDVFLEVRYVQNCGRVEVEFGQFFQNTLFQKSELAVQVRDYVEDDFILRQLVVGEEAVLSFLRVHEHVAGFPKEGVHFPIHHIQIFGRWN